MSHKFLIAAGALLAFTLPAAAQQSSQPSNSSSSSSQSGTNIRQHVKEDLQKAGFTAVQVMPESFLVRAKDKSGRPVMMVINPDSITAVTEMGGSGKSSSGSSSGGSGSSDSTKAK